MKPDQYQRAYSVFMQVVDLQGAERQAALDAACENDPDVRAWVEQLLADEEGSADGMTFENELGQLIQNASEQRVNWTQPGARLDERFEVVERIGAGGMAEVWKIRHLRLHAIYALKILTKSHPAMRRRFAQEGRMQGRIRHPNIVRIFDVIEVSSQPALVMEFVEGTDLEQFLTQNRPSILQLDALADDILRGVQAVHDARLVHRDLKPSNVLLAWIDDQITAKIADFGIARNLGFSDHSRLTRSGALLGTLAYMAPEQLRNARNADARSDIWALGCILYRMISGQEAFSLGDNIEMLVKICSGQRPPLSPNLPQRWLHAIDAALQPDPNARPQSCQALRELLDLPEDLAAQRISFRASSLQQRPSQLSRRDALFSTDSADRQAPPNNLPTARDEFVGRAEELAAIRQQLHQGERLITILGTAGLGKSRLALEVGRSMANEWPGGVWFVDLADARSLGGIWSVMGQVWTLNLGTDPKQQIGDALRQRGRTLLLLDNFERVAELAAETVGWWLDVAPEASILATSRRPLQIAGEVVYSLDLLEEREAIALFLDRAQRARRRDSLFETFEKEIRELVHRLDRLPLAIELAAARSRLYTPQQLLSRLSRRFDLLRSRSNDLPARQRTLWAALQWSWDMLDPVEQSIFAQCSVFEGGMALEDAGEVIAVDVDGVWIEEVLADLVDKSLLVSTEMASGEQRLSMLASIQAFAAEQLSDPQPVYLRHAEHFAQQYATTQDTLALSVELDNLIAAARRAMRLGREREGVACALMVSSIFERQGPILEGVSFLESLFETLSPMEPPNVLQRRLGMLLIHAGLPDRAEAVLTRLLDRAREGGDAREELMVYEQLAHLSYQQGRFERALVYLEDGLKNPSISELISSEKAIRNGLGVILGRLGRVDEALPHLFRSLELSRKMGDTNAELGILNNIGMMYDYKGDFVRAQSTLQEALASARAQGARERQSPLLNNLADTYLSLGQFEDALEAATEALELARQLGRRHNEIAQLGGLAEVYGYLGRFDEANEALEASAALIEQTGFRRDVVRMHVAIGWLHWMRGDLDQAVVSYQRALDSTNAGSRSYGAQARLALGEIALNRQQFDEAARYFGAAVDSARKYNNIPLLARALSKQADLARVQQDQAAARALLDEAASLIRPLTYGRYFVEVFLSRATLLLDEGDTPAARKILLKSKKMLRSRYDLFHQKIDALLASIDEAPDGDAQA